MLTPASTLLTLGSRLLTLGSTVLTIASSTPARPHPGGTGGHPPLLLYDSLVWDLRRSWVAYLGGGFGLFFCCLCTARLLGAEPPLAVACSSRPASPSLCCDGGHTLVSAVWCSPSTSFRECPLGSASTRPRVVRAPRYSLPWVPPSRLPLSHRSLRTSGAIDHAQAFVALDDPGTLSREADIVSVSEHGAEAPQTGESPRVGRWRRTLRS